MKKQGSVLIMFLWVLMIFSLFALSVAFRTRLVTKIQGFETERFLKQQNSFSALNLARYFLEIDKSAKMDSPSDNWYGIPEGFTRMSLSKKFGLTITDEESKLNINKVSPDTLVSVLETLRSHGIRLETDPRELASQLLAWRGETAAFGTTTVGLEHKKLPYESLDELLLVPKLNPKDAATLKPFLTVYGRSSQGLGLNLNTVHPYILEGVIRSYSSGSHLKEGLIRMIERLRSRQSRRDPDLNVFTEEYLDPAVFTKKLQLDESIEMKELMNFFLVDITVDSSVFTVQVHDIASRAVMAEAVLGPLGKRVSVTGSSEEVIDGPLPFSMIPNLEVLSWHENLSGAKK